MLLLSARTRQGGEADIGTRREVEEVLTFIYTRVYPESYSSDPTENRLYREYCTQLLMRELTALPTDIRSLSSAQLAAPLERKNT